MTEVPQIFLINLDRSSDRLAAFQDRNPHMRSITRFSAVDGSMLDRAELIRSGYITDDLHYKPGTLGCALSHIRLWELVVRENRSVTIFEDDIVISRQFEKRGTQLLSLLASDWDFIHWGYHLEGQRLALWIDLEISKVKIECYGAEKFADNSRYEDFQALEFPVVPVRLEHCWGTIAYSISPRGAQAALDRCLPLNQRTPVRFTDTGWSWVDEGIDVRMNEVYPTVKSYACMPQLVIHASADDSSRKSTDRSE
jgi:GR25 family glycosyltransferase involved in LPS biosynthesis